MQTMVKAQFKIQQMAFVLIALFVFFLLVGLFWITLQKKNLINQVNQLEENQALILSGLLSGISELNCGSYSDYCIDTDKLMVLMNKTAYSDFFPVESIRIVKLGQEKEIKCNFANYPNCNTFELKKSKNNIVAKGSFIALCRYEELQDYPIRKCDLGKIIIGYELR